MDKIEARIARRLVKEIFAAGYVIRVWEGEEWAGPRRDKVSDVMKDLGSTDSDWICVYWNEPGIPVRAGKILLIWGNGADLISDYSDSAEMERIIDPVQSYANTLD